MATKEQKNPGQGEPPENRKKGEGPARPEPVKARPPRPAPPKPRPQRSESLEGPSKKDIKKGPKANPYIVGMLLEAIAEKKESCNRINLLMAKNTKQKEMLNKIYLDDYKHILLLEDIYLRLTGEEASIRAHVLSAAVRGQLPLERLMLQKFDNIDFYKRLLFSIADQTIRDMVHEIIIDEQLNALKLNYIIGT